ncbi:hypothetical protein [Pasteuria penetrans]|uniref:hypothetical protein n=1 Tax=Pasteuria penetrans TaxID=86005 RepID=UPI000FB9AD11|nr:hypothetical protein [Pasteuria penetrans]
MVRTVKMGILFASTSLLAWMGGNSILAESREDQKNTELSENIHRSDGPNSSYTEEEKEKNSLILDKFISFLDKFDSKYRVLLEKSIRSPDEISKGDLKEFIDELNKDTNELDQDFGHTSKDNGMTHEMAQEQLWSALMRDAEEARRNPSKYKKKWKKEIHTINLGMRYP